MAKVIFGCGYLGERVAGKWRDAGDEVLAVTRSIERAKILRQKGLTPVVCDLMRPETVSELHGVTTALFSVGFDRTEGRTIEDVYVGCLLTALRMLPVAALDRFLYISSTGVYGQSGGDWVDESSPCQPAREGGWACLRAEQLLAGHALGGRAIVLRMAGLYGPGRIPRRHELAGSRPLAAPRDGYLNLIHVDDAAQVVVVAEQRAPLPSCFVVADGSPVWRADYYRELARLIGAAEPTFAPPRADMPAARRAASSKRLSNRRLRDLLGIELRYPTYREGLAQILAAEGEADCAGPA